MQSFLSNLSNKGNGVQHQEPASSITIRKVVRSASATNPNQQRASRRERAKQYIHRLEALLRERPHTPISLSDIAHILNLERTYCSKVFREISGTSFSEWIRRLRIEQAQALLRLDTHSITDVCLAVGYTDLTTFERNFRKELGTSPTSFRKAGQRQ